MSTYRCDLRLPFSRSSVRLLIAGPLAIGLFAALMTTPTLAASPIAVGDEVPSVTLPVVANSDAEELDLQAVAADSKAVVIFLRGYPGYQCGLCSQQVSGWVSSASKFASAGVPVVLVYPGPRGNLEAKANEFLGSSKLPKGFSMVMDPDYAATDAFGIRWNAPNETAYPSTFVVQDGKVTFADISKSHGGRTKPATVLAKLK